MRWHVHILDSDSTHILDFHGELNSDSTQLTLGRWGRGGGGGKGSPVFFFSQKAPEVLGSSL